ncbi:MAG: fluoride efflux transporter CrcB [Thermoleophilia bacterium]|nr:fluoride efflux transporter CrcB [Thermoleophilia bacterium]
MTVPEALEDARTIESLAAERRRSHRTHGRLQAAIFAGGMVGALARAGLAEALPWDAHGWPWATFLVNVTGTLLLGYFATRLQERLAPSTYRRPLLGTGVCGALTTFSTFQVEVIELARNGAAGTAAGYALASVTVGLVGVYLATALTRRVRLR